MPAFIQQMQPAGYKQEGHHPKYVFLYRYLGIAHL